MFLSLPCILGTSGACEVIKSTMTEDTVTEKLKSSVSSIHDLQQQLKFWLSSVIISKEGSCNFANTVDNGVENIRILLLTGTNCLVKIDGFLNNCNLDP